MGWCLYDNKECYHDGYCEDCDVYLNKKGAIDVESRLKNMHR